MAITYPYSLAAFADRLLISSVIWSVQRNDELSGAGDGRFFQAELAPPLWTGEVTLSIDRSDNVKQAAALVRKLHGAQEAFFMFDPLSPYPQSDPKGLVLGSANVQVNSVSTNRDAISLKGLPAGFVLTIGDKMQIAYGSNPVRYAFLEFAETGAANGSGATGQLGVFPHVPVGVTTNLSVILKKPACRVVIFPGSHEPGRARRTVTEGAGFKVIQKK